MSFTPRASMSPKSRDYISALVFMASPENRKRGQWQIKKSLANDQSYDIDWTYILQNYFSSFDWDCFIDKNQARLDKKREEINSRFSGEQAQKENTKILLKALFIEKDHPLDPDSLIEKLREERNFETAQNVQKQIADLRVQSIADLFDSKKSASPSINKQSPLSPLTARVKSRFPIAKAVLISIIFSIALGIFLSPCPNDS